MSTEPVAIAGELFAALENAWNAGDGSAFAEPFGDDVDFVDVRGVRHRGDRNVVASGHQSIFETIYRGSRIRYEVSTARTVSRDCVLAAIDATLDAPAGPLAGTNHSTITAVIVQENEAWRIVSFHNTLVTTDGSTAKAGSR